LTFLAFVGMALLAHSMLTTTFRDAPIPAAVTAPAAPPKGANASTRAEIGSSRPSSSGTSRRRVAFLIKGVPVEFYGIAWFLLIVCLEWAPGGSELPDVQDRFRLYIFCVSLPALVALFTIANALRARWLDFGWRQLIAAGCALGIFALAALSRHASWRTWRLVPADLKLFVGKTSTWIATAGFLGLLALRPSAAPAASNALPTGTAFATWYASQPRDRVPVDSRGAAVVVVKFNDYQCPPCKRTHLEYEPIVATLDHESPGKVLFVTMDYPLEAECNPYVDSDLHPSACEAAAAVRLAREHGKGEAMEQWLWEHQATLTPAGVTQAVRDIGGVMDFAERYPKMLEFIRADIETAHRLGVVGTPTHFINGVKLLPVPKQDFETALRYELAQAKNVTPPASN
jgi:protein-disulfide isomerase